MSLDIEPIDFIKRTALKERNEIIAKVNEIIDVINQAPQGLTVVEANLSLTSESTFEGTLTEAQFAELNGTNSILKTTLQMGDDSYQFYTINKSIQITPGETERRTIYGEMSALDGTIAAYTIQKTDTDYTIRGELKEYATVEMVEAIEDELGSAEEPGTIRGDIAANDAAAVHKTGYETIDGPKTFNDSINKPATSNVNFAMILKNNNPQGVIPANDTSSGFSFRPSDTNVNMAVLLHIINKTTGDGKIELSSRNYNYGNKGSILLITPADGSPYATCPNREYNAGNSTDIVNNGNLESRLGQLTKADVGLGNVDNTSDADKPISTAQREEFNNAFDDIRYLDDNKQTKLVSGVNIKTVNNTDILGSGNIPISTVGTWGNIGGQIVDQNDLQEQFATKQDNLVSGTNIKTVGGQSLMGSGNIPIPMGGGYWKVPETFSELISADKIQLCYTISVGSSATPSTWKTAPPADPVISYSAWQNHTIILHKNSNYDRDIGISNDIDNNIIYFISIGYSNGEITMKPYSFNGGGSREGSTLVINSSNYPNYISLSDCLIWISE